MIRTQGVAYSYDRTTILQFPDINCASNEHSLILGQSGSGKTTLLHLLAGLMRPTKGSIAIGNEDICVLNGSRLDHFRGRNIGLVFQVPHFVRSLSVTDNLALARHLSGLKPDPARITELLKHLGLNYKAKQRPDALSQGEKQRLAIARAVINHPKVLLADEPTSALDDANCKQVVSLLTAEAKKEGAALLIVTHDNRLREDFPKAIILEKIVSSTS